ncbi:hypothetical protein [Paenibacillus sp. PL2-23]|uniref:hypothetical protein n=1 Tax=Paenibacillus sp. PL2-23 TaxID=2100729 RepID=UPI0030F9BFFA
MLKNIAEATGGKYYHATTASDLSGIFEQTSSETVDLTRDTDGDGLSDYHEKRGMRVNTSWITPLMIERIPMPTAWEPASYSIGWEKILGHGLPGMSTAIL